MPYAWQENADREGSSEAKVPAGKHRVRIIKVEVADRDGNPYLSNGGDPQINVIMQDSEARTAWLRVTLSDKAAWVLAKLLGACDPPANLKRMEELGVEPGHFANEEWANQQLAGRELNIQVEYETGENNKKYQRVTPLRSGPPTPSELPPLPPSAVPAAKAPALTPPTMAAPPPPLSAPPPQPPPPTTDGTPTAMTKDEAWTFVLQQWANNPDQEKRNSKWLATAKEVGPGKLEREFTPEMWARVAVIASVPF